MMRYHMDCNISPCMHVHIYMYMHMISGSGLNKKKFSIYTYILGIRNVRRHASCRWFLRKVYGILWRNESGRYSSYPLVCMHGEGYSSWSACLSVCLPQIVM